MRDLPFEHKIAILGAMFAAVAAGLLWWGPIPQDQAYHDFADQRAWLGIANFADVVSNAPFLVVGIIGLFGVRGLGPIEARPYRVFFAGVALVSLGSAWYHLAPSDTTLVWDRLPMTVAFMALFAAILADRLARLSIITRGMPVLLGIGVASLALWVWSDDLRVYALVQFYPMAALPVICWLFPRPRLSGSGHLIHIVFWYALAKVLEHFDDQVFALSGEMVSGHSLKHLAAAMAAWAVLVMIRPSARRGFAT